MTLLILLSRTGQGHKTFYNLVYENAPLCLGNNGYEPNRGNWQASTWRFAWNSPGQLRSPPLSKAMENEEASFGRGSRERKRGRNFHTLKAPVGRKEFHVCSGVSSLKHGGVSATG